MTTYTVATEQSWWPGMDQPGYDLFITNADGFDVVGLQLPDINPETVAAALAEAGYPEAVRA